MNERIESMDVRVNEWANECKQGKANEVTSKGFDDHCLVSVYYQRQKKCDF